MNKRHVIAKYNHFIFRCSEFIVNGKNHWFVSFIDTYEESNDDMFLKYYKRLYPNYSLQIFKHNKKSLIKDIRDIIEEQLDHSYFFFLNRDLNLRKLLE
jgi:hypothetical protein